MMENYHTLLQAALQQGAVILNARTGKRCHVLSGCQLQYDLRRGFPAITTKRLAFRSAVGELLGFFRGYTSAADFRALGCGVWDKNANESPAWLANPNRKGTDDLGRIYRWTDWRDDRIARTEAERDQLVEQGFKVRLHDAQRGEWLVTRGINQIEAALRTILSDPSDRRIVISGWRPDEFHLAALPACHSQYAFVPDPEQGLLHLVVWLRSADLFLGTPFNTAEAAVFLSLMARFADYQPATLTLQAANAHLYEDHVAAAREQLTRSHLPAPRLLISDRVQPIADLDQVSGAFARVEPEDFSLVDYQSHGAIPAPMAA